jgi:GTPase SAR1 family protein
MRPGTKLFRDFNLFNPSKNRNRAAGGRRMDGKAIARKVIVVGDSGVGKTALVLRFVQGTYKEDLAGTIGGSCLPTLPSTGNNTLR